MIDKFYRLFGVLSHPTALVAAFVAVTGCGKTEPASPGFLHGQAVQLTHNGGSSPTWSPDGETIAYSNYDELWMVPSAGGDPTVITELDFPCREPHFLPHLGQRLILFRGRENSNRHSIWQLNLNSADQPNRIVEYPWEISSPTWLRSGQQIAFVSTGLKGILIYDFDIRQTYVLNRREGWADSVRSIAASPTEDLLYFIEGEESSKLFSIPPIGGEASEIAGNPITALGSPLVYHSLDPSWDGTKLAVTAGSPENLPESWSILNLPAGGGDFVPLTDYRIVPDCRDPAWSADGSRIAFECQGQVWILELES